MRAMRDLECKAARLELARTIVAAKRLAVSRNVPTYSAGKKSTWPALLGKPDLSFCFAN